MFWKWMKMWFSVLAPVYRLPPTTPASIHSFNFCVDWYYLLELDDSARFSVLAPVSRLPQTTPTSIHSVICVDWYFVLELDDSARFSMLATVSRLPPSKVYTNEYSFIYFCRLVLCTGAGWLCGSLCWLQYPDYIQLHQHVFIHSFVFVDWYYVLELDDSVVLCAGSSIQITSNYTNIYSFIHLFV